MSMWSDYEADSAFERDFPFGVPCDEWTTKAGGKIRLVDMTESHIRNCMRIVGEDDMWYGRFKQELARRAENAAD